MILVAITTPLGEANDIFSIETLDVDGKTYIIIWVGLGRPDLTIKYCGLNYIYYKPLINVIPAEHAYEEIVS